MTYTDEQLLSLSGIQHIAFCPRQYALAYIEQQWSDNVLTVEGNHLHERVDDPLYVSSARGVVTLRSVRIASFTLGLNGIADVVELHLSITQENAMQHPCYAGFWRPVPVEFKRGSPKITICDEAQLCAQAIALEEMYDIVIPMGYIYYGQTRHREAVEFTDELRRQTIELAAEMHRLFDGGITPVPEPARRCRSCSLRELCLPEQIGSARPVQEYLTRILDA